ncbi:UvrD-helicase domain-containing protein [Verrucomicrobiaceae bacterium 5K15]|uniref:DNA 3'-5' helicase n=1 Tax=Oceaniferula flava TaxID=2800421 RepID=A0AAE2S8Z2_9BACT|nr:UvrD-helicase domain-containing protein [Oceaniferula flavus]MBK1853758.1 UvrD-helicase domain-containing protein [Oceaniferula flavus]MBM1135065.1 UvrD-helicase domain-containing protein [Oceaniferula flavus]
MAREYRIASGKSKPGGSGIDYAAELNEQQYAAVASAPGPALVIAGAGSGKTRTLTHRVAYLLDQGVDPGNILLLTFTNKAAREMLERVQQLVPSDISALWSGTFHSIGNRILRRHADELGFTKSFSILDRDDQKSLMTEVVKSCNIDTGGRRFPKADLLASIFSLAENTSEDLNEILEIRYPHLEEWSDEIHEVQKGYRKKKKQTNSMDFDDLLILTLKLLQDDEDLRHLYQRKFRHVLVDEYQDTNKVQCDLIDLLVGEKQYLMVVGDDAQSIYSWRGADMSNILSFQEKYLEAQVFKIETNYRSTPDVLELSNAAIRPNKQQYEKELRAVREQGMTPALVPLDDPSIQAEFIGERIDELIGEGVEPEEIAVLYRAHYHSMEIQMELTRRQLPFQITSGLRFFEQAHIKDVSAMIRFVVNSRDEVSFKRMALLLPGIGAKTADNLWTAWTNSAAGRSVEVPKSFSETLLSFKVPAKAKDTWQQLCHTLDELAPDGKFERPSNMIFSILEGVYQEYMSVSFDNHEHRRNDIEQLMQYGESYEDVLEFLAQLSLMSSVDGDPNNKEKKDEGVMLSSIHQAKGLEWKVVFLVWLADGMFPNGRVLESDDEEMLEEERRLFYVAVTRAKDQLYLTYPMTNPKSYTGDYMTRPSRFLDAIPTELTEEWKVSAW